ncbi:MAG: hypothetical protein ABL917_00765 [Parcubacteria group bacterium]
MVSNLPQREEYLRKKRKKKLIRYGLIIFLLFSHIALSSYIAHTKEFRISKVVLSGGVLVTQNDIELETTKHLGGKYIWLFPKNNAFLYKKKDLREYLKNTFKRIDTIDIKLEGFQTLLIKITERKPYAIWCDKKYSATDIDTDGVSQKIENCYFMDQNSAIFAPAPHFSGDAYFKYYGAVATTSPIGSYFMSSSTEFMNVSNFIENMKKIGVRPQYLLAKDNDEFVVVMSGGGEVYFDMREDLAKVASNLDSLLQTPGLSSMDRSNLELEYIDLRFGNKLFYKLKE